MASRRSQKQAQSSRRRSARSNSPGTNEPALAERQQLMSIFGSYPANATRDKAATAAVGQAPSTDNTSNSLENNNNGNITAEGSSGSLSSHHRIAEFSSPSPPSSANASTQSSGHLPENVHLSMPGIARPVTEMQSKKSFSADQSRAELRHQQRSTTARRTEPQPESPQQPQQRQPVAEMSAHQRKKIVAAYNNQFAHLLGTQMQQVTPSANGESPAVSLVSGSSFNSPRTITLEDLQRSSRMQPRRAALSRGDESTGSVSETPAQTGTVEKGKWSQATTPSPGKDRDSGLFGNQPFSFTSPANASSGVASPRRPGGFEPIAEIDEDTGSSWSQTVARAQGVTNLNIGRRQVPQFDEGVYGDDGGGESSTSETPDESAGFSHGDGSERSRPRYDVHVPPPETLARTPTLITRSPTPTRMLEQQQRPRTPSRLSTSSASTTQGRRRRATTVSHGEDSVTHGGDARSRRSSASNNNTSYSTHSRSRSFGSSSEHITLQQIQNQRMRLEQQQQLQGRNDVDDLAVPLIPPPPEGGALQFLNPFVGRSGIGASGGAVSAGSPGVPAGTDSSEGIPEYLYERVSPHRHAPESVTHTRIRHRKQRNPSSVVSSVASPAYTLSSAYSPSNAGSNVTYELTFLGMHRIADPASHANMSQVISDAGSSGARPIGLARSDSRRRSSSMASDRRFTGDLSSSPVPGSPSELRSSRRRQMHSRSGSVGSRVSSMRDEIEQRQAQELAEDAWAGNRPKSAMSSHNGDHSHSRPTTPARNATTPVLQRWENARREAAGARPFTSKSSSSSPGPAGQAARVPMTPKSRKVAEIRERIEEWQQRTEASDSLHGAMPPLSVSSGSGSHSRGKAVDSALSASSAATALGAQQNIGEIESVRASTGPAKTSSSAAAASSGSPSSGGSPISADNQPRLKPLTPAMGYQKHHSGHNQLERVQALGRSNTQASRDSKHSFDTVQSSNVPPSLYGSDKSVFSTPLLSGLPPVSVPSDIASLRTQKTATTTKTVHRPSIPGQSSSPRAAATPASAPEDRDSRFLGTVMSAVSSPVSVGGHKKQSLVTDARSASSEILQDLKEVKRASPKILQTSASPSSSSAVSSSHVSRVSGSSIMADPPRLATHEVMASPAVAAPSVLVREERRAWAANHPTDRPPLSGLSDESMSSGQSSEWDEKLRLRAQRASMRANDSSELSIRPEMSESPEQTHEPKTTGGLLTMAAHSGLLNSSDSSTPPVTEEFRKERVFSALATLEGAKPKTQMQQKTPRSRKVRHNRDPLRSGSSSPSTRPVPSSHDQNLPSPDGGQQLNPNMQSKFSLTDSSRRTSGISKVSDASPVLMADSGKLSSVSSYGSPHSSDHPQQQPQKELLPLDTKNVSRDEPDQLLSAISTPVATGISRPPSQRMGRHGSSPLNPYNGSPTSIDSGSPAPPLPALPTSATQQQQQPPGLIQRITGTIRRKRPSAEKQPVSAPGNVPSAIDPQQVMVFTQTPLPKRWWRNIKESMYAPIPPLHGVPQQQQQQHMSAALPADVSTADPAQVVDQLPARPARRHSFSGSTNIEQEKITAALSPRENVRRKATLAARVRDMFRGRRPGLASAGLGPMAAAGAAGAAAGALAAHSHHSGSSGPVGAPLTERLNLHIANTVSSDGQTSHLQPTWAPSNPFNQSLAGSQIAPGPRRRASFDTLSVHQMAEIDRQDMQSRLNHLISPHLPAHGRTQTGLSMVPESHQSLANSPHLGHSQDLSSVYSPSSKFSFTAPLPAAGSYTPKPLPATPRQKSQHHISVDSEQSVFKFPPKPEMAQKDHQVTSPSPIFKVSDDSASSHSRVDKGKQPMQYPQTAPIASAALKPTMTMSKQEMIQRPNPASSALQFTSAPGSNDVLVNTAQVTGPEQLPPIMSQQVSGDPGQQQYEMQQMPYTAPEQSTGLQKRPSLLQRLTSGWRKPVPSAPFRPQGGNRLEPISEENIGNQSHVPNASHHTNPLKAAAGVAGVSAAAGLLGRLFQPAATVAAKDEAQVPNVNVVNSPVNPYGHAQYQTQNTVPNYQQQQQQSSGSTMYQAGPVPVATGLSPTITSQDPNIHAQLPGFMNTVNSTSMPPLSHTPMPGQSQQYPYAYNQQNPYGPSQPAPGMPNAPGMQVPPEQGSYAYNAQLPGQQQQQPQLQQQQQGYPPNVPNAPMTYSGESQYPQQPLPAHNAPTAASASGANATPVVSSGPSKIMTMMASIPVLGSLFAKKSQPSTQLPSNTQMPQQPPPGGFNPALVDSQPSAPGRYDHPHHGPHRPGSYSSYSVSSANMHNQGHGSHGGHPHGPNQSGQANESGGGGGGGIGSILHKAMGMFNWAQIPLLSFALRETAKNSIKPLIGRYALQYPLVEAEESAAVKAAAAKVEQRNVVHAGALRALDAKEFRHAARGLRYHSLDNQLENVYVPRFSRLRKYRRAPEVWDDEDAHKISQRVHSRLNTVQSMRGRENDRLNRVLSINSGARRPGEPRLRGGGGRITKNRNRVLDLERGERVRYVEGHQGSGELGIDNGTGTLRGGGGGEYQPEGDLLAHRIGAFFAGRRNKNNNRHHQDELRQQSSGSFLSSPTRHGLRHQNVTRVSPGSEGLSRIIDEDDFDDEDFVHIHVSVEDSDKNQSSQQPQKEQKEQKEQQRQTGYERQQKREPNVSEADSEHESDIISIRRVPTEENEHYQKRGEDVLRSDVVLDDNDDEDPRPVNSNGRTGLRQRLFGALRPQKQQQKQRQQKQEMEDCDPVEISAAEQPPPPAPVAVAAPPNATNKSSDQKKQSSSASPMFPPFSHLPVRAVEYIMHRVGEPRVFIGSVNSQLVPPNNQAVGGDGAFADTNPYRTGTEWNFVESVKFSSPYPTRVAQVQNKSVWARINSSGPGATTTKRKLMVKSRNNEIARWPAHIEVIRDFIQLLALVLGACGFTKSPVNSSVGKRWPWMILGGIPETLGLMWADLSTTTGKSIGFFIFFGAVAAFVMGMWSYGLYLERPPPRAPKTLEDETEKKSKKASTVDGSGDGAEEITFEEELAVEPSPFNIVGRLFGSMPRRQRMNILYFVLTTLYIPVVKLCLEAIVWSQGYWAVANPYRESDNPSFPKPADSQHRDPSKFCYTTTMRVGHFNGAFVILPLAVLLFLGLGLALPMQIYQLSKKHMPRVPGWLDGKTPGYRLPPADIGGPSRPTSALAAAAAPPGAATEAGTVRNLNNKRNLQSRNTDRGRTRDGTRDDPNPMLSANALLQGIDKLGIMNPEVFGNLAMLYNLANSGGGGYGPSGNYGSGTEIAGLLGGVWNHMQKWLANRKDVEDDPYLGMEKDEAYQARLRDMKQSHRNRHLATVQYRRALDTDTSDYRFLYVSHYPIHASDPARLLLWKLLAVIVAVVLAKDNCWAKARTRHSLDAGRNAALLIVTLLMLRSHHSHRPYFDPTANLSGLIMRLSVIVAVIFAFPLFLISDPLSATHVGLCITLAILNFMALCMIVWLASSALPGFQMVIRGSAQPLTLSPGILVATSPYDPRLRRLLIERVWQDTWSAILLASRDFRLLPNHRIAFCRTRAHPPYMVNYIGFAAERHLENLHLYDAIGRRAYCQAVEIERGDDARTALMDEIAREFTGPDMYFNPYAGSGDLAVPGNNNFYGIGRSEVQSWFGKAYILHFPFMVCMVYDELPNVVVPIADEVYLRLYLQQNRDDPIVRARRDVRRRLRALDGQYVTLTFIENAGPNGMHVRYCLPEFAEDNDAYLAQFNGRRRVLFRGVINIQQQAQEVTPSGVNVAAGFACSLRLTDELIVDDEYLVNNLSRAHNAFRMAFWQTGHAPETVMLVRTEITQQSRQILGINEHNRHLLGLTPSFDMTVELRALFEENSETIDARLPVLDGALRQYMRDSHAAFVRKRAGLTPSFHIDVFAPGPESWHVREMARQAAQGNGAMPQLPATPALFGGNPALNGEWLGDEHGRLSCIPTLEQLAERLERFEDNRYMRDLLVDHGDDIRLLYERLRTLVPSSSNDPTKFAWYLFWDDIYRRYGKPAKQGGVAELRRYEVDFNPLYPQALAYYPQPRYKLERFLYERGLWKPLKTTRPGLLARLFGRGKKHSARDQYSMDLMPVPGNLPGVVEGGNYELDAEARVWRAGDGYDDFSDLPFEPGAPAGGFLHSGLLNRLYAWLDVIAYGTNRSY